MALPHIWGTDGLVVNYQARARSATTRPVQAGFKGKNSVRLKRPTLLAFAFAKGKDPFALYNDPKAYAALMDDVGKTLAACKPNIKFFWDNKDQLLNGERAGEIVGAMMWDTGGWKLNGENPDIQYIAPQVPGRSAGSTRSRCRRKGRNDAAAYAWINFNMRPEIAAKVASVGRQLHGREGRRPAAGRQAQGAVRHELPGAALKNIKWYPAVPPGIEDIEGKVLDRVKAAS